MSKCPECGTLYGTSDDFCPECGKKLIAKRHNLNKFLILIVVVIVTISILFFTFKTQKINSTTPTELPTTMSTATPVDKEKIPISEETQKIILSQSLKDCLKDYVYGKEDNWVNLAEERCEPLLPNECLFAYGKEAYSEEEYPLDYKGADYSHDSFIHKPSGKFGVYCPTKPSKKLEDCMTGLKYPDSSDATGRRVVYSHCWYSIPDDCMFGDYYYYCLVP